MMYLYDSEFHIYAKTNIGISEYKKNFNICSKKDNRLIWRLFGRKHRENDLPAVMRCTTNGKYISADRYEEPMDENPYSWQGGYLEYYFNGNLHRENDKPAIIHENGSCCYYYNGMVHRRQDINCEDQPAIIHSDGMLEYYINGKFHRTKKDGLLPPAVIRHDGTKAYYENGVKIHNVTTYRPIDV